MSSRSAPARHRVCRLVIASSIPLPEAFAAGDGSAVDVEFDCVDGLPLPSADWRWYQHWTLPDGRRSVSFARRGTEFLVAFESVHFTFSPPTMRVRAFRDPATPLVTVRHLLLDQVLPLVLSARGQLALHAGCVATEHGAVAFVGESGSGKSTLVASFAAAGAPIITDDSLVLEPRGDRWYAVQSYPGVRLWPETADIVMRPGRGRRSTASVAHYNSKIRIVPADDAEPLASAPLRRVYLLDPQNTRISNPLIRIERPAGRDAFVPLVKHTYRLDLEDAAGLHRDFVRLAALVDADLVRRLAVPFALSELDRVRDAIDDDIRP